MGSRKKTVIVQNHLRGQLHLCRLWAQLHCIDCYKSPIDIYCKTIFLLLSRPLCQNCKCPQEDHNSSFNLHSDPLAAATSAVMAATQASQNQAGSNNNQTLNSSIDSKTNNTATTTANTANGQRPQTLAHSDDDSGCALEEYTWVPPGLKPDQVGFISDRYFCPLMITTTILKFEFLRQKLKCRKPCLGDFCDIWGRVFDNLGSLASVRFSHLSSSLIFWEVPIFV